MGRKDHPVAKAYLARVAAGRPFLVTAGEIVVTPRFCASFGLVIQVDRLPSWAFMPSWREGRASESPLLSQSGERLYAHMRDEAHRILASLEGFDAGEPLMAAMILMPAALAAARTPLKAEAA